MKNKPIPGAEVWWSSGSGRIEFKMPEQAAMDCYHVGACDEDVEHWLPEMRERLAHVSDEAMVLELREYGAWDAEELADRDANIRRLTWLAAGDYHEEEEHDYEEPGSIE